MKKKRHILIVIIAVLIFLVYLVAENGDSDIPYFSVVTDNNCQDVYGIRYEYYIGDVPVGGMEMMSDPKMSSPLGKGPLYANFSQKEFPEEYQLLNGEFGLTVSVISEDGSYVSTGYVYKWEADYGEEYDFSLKWDYLNGYVFSPMYNMGNGYREIPIQ